MANQTASLPSPHDVSYCRTCKGDIFLITVNEWERYFGHALSTGKDRRYEASGTSCSQAPYLSRTKVPGHSFFSLLPPAPRSQGTQGDVVNCDRVLGKTGWITTWSCPSWAGCMGQYR